MRPDDNPRQIGRYRIIRALGQGSMGCVYLGYDPVIDREIALKTIDFDQMEPPEAEAYRARFQREAQASGRLSHPNIVTIHDIGEVGPQRQPYIVMEFIDGPTLEQAVVTSPHRLPIVEALDVVLQIAEALGYAHSNDVIHRDVKPANIILTSHGRAVLTDFGIAQFRRMRDEQRHGELGTLSFMAPERIQGQRADGRADLFSLGVVLYWLLTGEQPFSGSDEQVMFRLVHREPTPPSQHLPELGAATDAVLAAALMKQPADRYQSGRHFAEELARLKHALVSRPSR